MFQNDGEPAWQDKTYTARKDKKTLDRNKQGRSSQERGMRITPTKDQGYPASETDDCGINVSAGDVYHFKGDKLTFSIE